MGGVLLVGLSEQGFSSRALFIAGRRLPGAPARTRGIQIILQKVNREIDNV